MGTARQWGLIRVAEDTWVFENLAAQTYNAPLTQGVYNNFAIGSFQMPFAGQLHAEIYSEWTSNSYEQINTRLSASSPAPTVTSDVPRICDAAGGAWRGIQPCYAYWDNLTSGQTVTLTFSILAAGGWPTTFWFLTGYLRAFMQT
jgi:hypothetical protein